MKKKFFIFEFICVFRYKIRNLQDDFHNVSFLIDLIESEGPYI